MQFFKINLHLLTRVFLGGLIVTGRLREQFKLPDVLSIMYLSIRHLGYR